MPSALVRLKASTGMAVRDLGDGEEQNLNSRRVSG